MSELIFCGKARQHKKYDFLFGSICLDDIPAEFITHAKNGKRYVNIKISKRRQADNYDNTHSITVDTYKKDKE